MFRHIGYPIIYKHVHRNKNTADLNIVHVPALGKITKSSDKHDGVRN